jgi:NAD(P)H-hydrate epimerase
MIRLTREQVREIDRRSIEEYHIPGIALMENAAHGAATIARAMMLDGKRGNVLIICGGGNNGGDGLAIARLLHNRQKRVQIVLANPLERYTGDALTNLKTIQVIRLPLWSPEQDSIPAVAGEFDLVVDALFGTGLTTPPRETRWIDYMNTQPAPVLAIDLPSGLDCDTGLPLGTCVRATQTVTFVARKAGFANPESRQYTGPVIVADIGCPRELVEEFSHPRDNINPS